MAESVVSTSIEGRSETLLVYIPLRQRQSTFKIERFLKYSCNCEKHPQSGQNFHRIFENGRLFLSLSKFSRLALEIEYTPRCFIYTLLDIMRCQCKKNVRDNQIQHIIIEGRYCTTAVGVARKCISTLVFSSLHDICSEPRYGL